MSDARTQRGIDALKAGDKRKARRLFSELVRENANNPAAWWYLAASVEHVEEQVRCLEHVVRLRPDHEEARAMLGRARRRMVTPSTGIKPPVFDTEEFTTRDNRVMVTTVDLPRPGADDGADDNTDGDSGKTIAVLTGTVLVALISIVAAAVLIWTGTLPEGVIDPTPGGEPTLIPFTFDVPACAVNASDEAVLVFINNTSVAVYIARGLEGAETRVLELGPGEQGSVLTPPASRIRYIASSPDPTYGQASAFFEIEEVGNTCRVPVFRGGD